MKKKSKDKSGGKQKAESGKWQAMGAAHRSAHKSSALWFP